MVAWLLPPFRQFRGKYFYYFLVLGLEGLTTMLFAYLQINILKLYNIVNIILLLTLVNPTSIKKYRYLFIISLAGVLLINHISDTKLLFLANIIGYMVIFYIFLKNTVIDYYKNDSLRVGFLIILLYQITIILKFYFVLRNIHIGLIFYYLTTAFENFIAIFFTIYKVEEAPSIKPTSSLPKQEKS